MARGSIYYITETPQAPIGFDSVFFTDDIDSIGADYADDKSPKESESALKALEENLFGKGARIIHDNTEGYKFAFTVDNPEKFKQDYFGPALAKLKQTVESLQLFDVVKSAPMLDNILNEEYGDRVYLDESELLTYDNFIRRIEPGKTYYVLNRVLYLH